LIGESDIFKRVVAAVEKIAPYEVPVLIEGETGTGKELVARALHYGSSRKAHAFVPVNCGALPESLVENELFGHRRGAYTDAREDQPGLVSLAHSGTLFLDEVDALPTKGQVALLRFLEDRQYRPVGDRSHHSADVRVIAATNRDLESLCTKGAFRLDLLHRLKLAHLRIPPLRERQGDPSLLATHFLQLAAVRFNKRSRPISPVTAAWFEQYEWPGNVRELEHLVYREFLACDDDVLYVRPPACLSTSHNDGSVVRYRDAKARAIAAFEVQYLGEIMRRAAWNVSAAARLMSTDRRHLGRLLRKYRISPSDE
jgi:two-component system, NtrC family, response regulator GlrR